jgi:hypothetical protein
MITNENDQGVINLMIARFLSWKLPKNFSPDAGISFEEQTDAARHPCGTNLFDAEQAKMMILDMLGDDVAVFDKSKLAAGGPVKTGKPYLLHEALDPTFIVKNNDAGYVEGIGIDTAQLKQEASELKEIASELMVSEIPDTYAIESAISNTAEAAKGAEGTTLAILNQHLKYLCEMQRDFIRAECTCAK